MSQLSLFTDYNTQAISIPEVATQLQVSVATIRNWIKVGYLHQVSAYAVTRDSVDSFTHQYIGKTKLVSRANKSSKDVSLTDFDIARYAGSSISDAYESSLSDSYRNKEGIFYTPSFITSDMMKDVHANEHETFLEPCCGSGNFVLEAVRHGVKPENIYAFDTDEKAVEITKRRLFEATGYNSPNIICADFLQVCKTQHRKFDYIYTNPPWGKKIPKAEKMLYVNTYKAGNSNDTCALFFFASLTLLKEGGEMGFLLPEAFFNIAVFEDVRKRALLLKIQRLIDYDKAFKGLMTKAMAIILRNTQVEDDAIVQCDTKSAVRQRTQRSFNYVPKSILNFAYDEEVADTIKYLYGIPHTTLAGNASWGLGIVTGNNSELCSDTLLENYVPVYRGKDITTAGLATPTLFINKDLRNCQQVAPMSLYLAPEKLIYRFISDKLVFYCDTQQRYILNSANMLVLNTDFPIHSRQLTDVMNSKFMNWLFQTIFATHKILRGDLEILPIYTEYFHTHSVFDEEKYLDFINVEEKNGTYRIKK